RDAEVEGEDLLLREPMLEAERDHRLAELARGRSAPARQDLYDLLRDGGSPLHHPPRAEVVAGGTGDGDGIDPGVMEEPRVLRGQGGAHEHVRKMVGVDGPAALAGGGKGLAQ